LLSKKFNTALDSVKELTLRGHFTDAHKALDKLLKKDPTSKNLLNSKAHIFIAQGFFNESIKISNKCLIFYPENLEAFYNLGIAYSQTNQKNLAIDSFNNCIKIDRNFIDAYINLAKIYLQTYDIKNSISVLNYLKKINPALEICHQLLAQSYRLINDYHNQKKSLQSCIEINPQNANNYIYLAFIEAWQNNTYAAKELLQKALSINPSNTFAIFNLMEIDKKSQYYFNIDLLNQININYHLNNNDLIYYHLSVSKYYENKDDEQFIQSLLEANKIKKYSINYNSDYFNNFKEKVFQIFESIDKNSPLDNHYQPIFIIGLPRSGSSLVEQILLNMPTIKTCGEVELLNYEFSENLDKINMNILLKISEKYLHHISSITQSEIFIDKLPLNLFWIGFIKLAFPKAKFIYTYRNKFDNCFSILKTFFGDAALPFSYSVTDINAFYRLHLDFIQSWLELFNKDIFQLNFDSLVENPTTEVNKLLQFLNLEYDESILNLKNNGAFIQTASFIQARNKITKLSHYDKYHKFFPEFLD